MAKLTDELVISFLFPPANYVSGITVSKRIIENNEIVDVLQSKVKNNKHADLVNCVDKFVNKKIFIDMDCDVDQTDCIFKFINNGLKAIKKDYTQIYSRSWLMANHFLASEYKFKNKQTCWTAEFSDPLIYDTSNNEKTYKSMIVDNKDYIEKINTHIADLNRSYPAVENESSAYFIAEYLVYLFADKIIFTNENQREIMLKQFPIDVYDMVLAKSEIKPHPTLSDRYYHLKECKLDLDEDYINLAYFGNDYYGKRHFEGLFYALESLNHKYKDKIRLHFFINDKKLLKRLISQLSFKDNIKVKKPLNYLEFLNATTKFDVLIVNDIITKENFDINPYLPSKLSDYLGSSSDIWAMVEDGSTLSYADVKYKSSIGDYDSSREIIIKILHDNGFVDEEYSFDEYYYKRLTYLNELYEKEFRKNLKLKKELKKLKSKKRFKIL